MAPPHHPYLAAGYDLLTAPAERRWFADQRRRLAEGLTGTVLDLGTGTGAMLPYYAAVAENPRVIAVEPDPAMHRRAMATAAELDLDVAFLAADGAHLPLQDDCIDGAVAAMVLCTVANQAAAIDELVRVLRPGGELRAFEHVAAEGWRHTVQRTVAPAWERVAGGCQLTRSTGEALASHPHLEVDSLDRLAVGMTPVYPFVAARLRRA